MSPFEFIIGALAVWRLTHLFAREDGPFEIVARVRRRAGSRFWGTLLDCFYCLSLWVAIPFAYAMAATWLYRILLWLALSGMAIFFNRVLDRFAPEMPSYIEEAPEQFDHGPVEHGAVKNKS